MSLAFPEYEIVFSNEERPHLIVKTPDGKYTNSKWDAPYIFWSGERYGIKRNRRNCPLLVGLLSRTPYKNNHFYTPYILEVLFRYHKSNIRQYVGGVRKKFLCYIASNCRKNRDNFFSLAKQYDDSSEALGKCMNTGNRAKGGWNNLSVIYKDYIFGIAMENRDVPGYVTEKIIAVFSGGAISIYCGDSDKVSKWFNPNAYIDVNNFDNFEQVIAYMDYLVKNPKLLHAMQTAPIFRYNKLPEDLDFFDTVPNQHALMAAEYIRRAFFRQVLNNMQDDVNH